MANFTDQFTYGVRKIQRQLEANKPIVTFFRNRYFSGVVESEDETVSVEVRRRGRVLLPSVRRTDSPLNVGAVAPHTVRTYTPPFFFFEATGTIDEAKKRVFGEPVEAPYSRAQRMYQIMAEKIDLGIRESLLLNEEAQCSQIIKTGKVIPMRRTQDGQLYQADEIDFGVDGELVGGNATAKWTTDLDIVEQIANYAELLFNKTGKYPTEIVLGKNAFAVLRKNKSFNKALDNRRIEGNSLYVQPYAGYPGVAFNGIMNVPLVGDLVVLSYNNEYAYEYGVNSVQMIGDNDMLLTAPDWGTMGYAGLYDKAGNGMPAMVAGKTITHAEHGTASNHFAYSAYIQSAPLAMPTQLDAWVYKTVIF